MAENPHAINKIQSIEATIVISKFTVIVDKPHLIIKTQHNEVYDNK